MEIDMYRPLLDAGLIPDDLDLDGFDEPAFIEGYDDYSELLNGMHEEDLRGLHRDQ